MNWAPGTGLLAHPKKVFASCPAYVKDAATIVDERLKEAVKLES
jgi:hypothetical protein